MLRGKDALLGNYVLDFLEISTSGRFHRDIKILKILASNAMQFRIYGIFRKLQIDDDEGGLPNTTFFEITSAWNNLWSWKFSWVSFLTQEIQKWHQNCPKTYWYYAIGKSDQNLLCGIYLKKMIWHYNWVNLFFNHTFLNTINLIWWKNELKFFLGSLTIFNWSQTIFQN